MHYLQSSGLSYYDHLFCFCLFCCLHLSLSIHSSPSLSLTILHSQFISNLGSQSVLNVPPFILSQSSLVSHYVFSCVTFPLLFTLLSSGINSFCSNICFSFSELNILQSSKSFPTGLHCTGISLLVLLLKKR